MMLLSLVSLWIQMPTGSGENSALGSSGNSRLSSLPEGPLTPGVTSS